jgi:hypothetical protein
VRTNDQRGLTGQRLQELRLRQGFGNQKDAAAHITNETGVVGLSGGVWGEYESGRKDENGKLLRSLSAKHRAAIESVWGPIGDQAPVQPAATGAGQSADVTALLAMVQGLITTIDAERAEWREERRALWARLDRILPPDGATPDAPADAGDGFETSDLTEAGRLAAEYAHDEMAQEDPQARAASPRPSASRGTPVRRTRP